MIAHAAKYPALDHDLGSILAQYFWNRRWKNYANEDFEGYNLLDVHRTAQAWDKVNAEVQAAYPKCNFYYRQAVHLDLDVARRMRETGILTSAENRQELLEACTREKTAAADKFYTLCPGVDLGQDGNTGAIRKLFFEVLKVKPLEYTDGGAPSLNGFFLRWCKLNSTKQIASIASALLAYKEPAKLISTYLKGKFLDEDGTIHANWASSWRTINGRWASRKPNLQNIPPRLRSMFVARPGKVLVEFDYAQIELWFQALFSQDNEMLDWHDQGVDIHTENAKKLVGWKESDAPEVRKKKRDGMKNGAYGLFYNFSKDITAVMAAFWRKGIEMKKSEIEALRDIWFNGRPKLYHGQRWLVNEAQRNGYSESFGGRRFYFYGGEVDKNQALNLPISSSVGDLMNDSITKVSAAIDWNETTILAQIHDSLLMETTQEALPKTKQVVMDIMQQTVQIRGRSLKFMVDAKSGLNWSKLEKLK
jgi:DNA polymerase-1